MLEKILGMEYRKIYGQGNSRVGIFKNSVDLFDKLKARNSKGYMKYILNNDCVSLLSDPNINLEN